MVSVRIVTADHYMSAPTPGLDVFYSDFRGTEVKQVPIIRIFGSTQKGKKVCLHVHGVFPYIYVPYDGVEPHDREGYKLASGLDKALNVSLGKSNANTQHVYKISLVSGRPFYGYHEKEHQFYKIYLYNPIMVKRSADLLQSGAILNKRFQPHEAHLTFILQFFIDFNLYGMNFINLLNVHYRRNPNAKEVPVTSPHGLAGDSVLTNMSGNKSIGSDPEDLYLPESVSRMSTCELEMDALATSISNRSGITDDLTVIPGLAALWEEERERRRMHGLSSQLSIAPSDNRDSAFYTKSELFYRERLQNQLQQEGVFLNSEKMNNSETASLDTSGYPSETPENMSLQDASMVEIHVPSRVRRARSQLSQHLELNSEEDDNCNVSQNSILLDTQDQILMNDLGNMLDDSQEDSILGTQTPCPNDIDSDEVLEKLAEEVEDNQLLEMSQVFHWEEKKEESPKNTEVLELDPEEGNECTLINMHEDAKPSTSATTLHKNDNPSTSATADIKSTQGREQSPTSDANEDDDIIYDWETDFLDSDSMSSFEGEKIPQLDGADDSIDVDRKLRPHGLLSKSKRRLGVRGRLSLLSPQNVASGSKPPSPQVDGNFMDTSAHVGTHKNSRPSGNNPKKGFPILVLTESIGGGFRPLHAVAKHRRVNELRRQGRMPLSVTKEKPKDVIPKSRANEGVPVVECHPSENREGKIETEVGDEMRRNLPIASSKTNVKPCSVRLELLSESHVNKICGMHCVHLSSYSADLLKKSSIDNEDISCNLGIKELLVTEKSYGQAYKKNMSRKFGIPKTVSTTSRSSFVSSESFQGCSAPQVPKEMPKNLNSQKIGGGGSIMKDNSFSSLDTSVLSLKVRVNKPSPKRKSLGVSILRSPKSQRDRGNSSTVSFKPLDVKIQKSPVRHKVDSTCKPSSQPDTALPSCSQMSENSTKGEFVRRTDDLKCQESPISSTLRDNLESVIEDVDERSGACYEPLKVLVKDPPLPAGDEIVEKKNSPSTSQEPSSSKFLPVESLSSLSDNRETKVRKQLKFSGEVVEDVKECVLESDSSSNESPEGEQQESSRKSTSGSSCDEEDLGIVSFCDDDIFNCSFSTQSIREKHFMKSQRLTLSPLVLSNDECVSSEKEVNVNTSEMESLLPMDDSPSEIEQPALFSSSSGSDSEPEIEKQNKEEACYSHYSEDDDCEIEFAPLLRAPSRKEVECYRDGMDQKGLPFCSNPKDIPSKPIEAVDIVLRLYSDRPSDLPAFENCLGCLGLEGHRNLILQNTFGAADDPEIDNQLRKISKSALLQDGGTREIVITPCEGPPGCGDVLKWLNDKGCDVVNEMTNEVASHDVSSKKVILGVGCNLGSNDDDDDNSDLISLSPCSSLGSQGLSERSVNNKMISSFQSTPVSSLRIRRQSSSNLSSPVENCLAFSPIQECCEDDDIIMCTPPPLPVEEKAANKKDKGKGKMHPFSRRRLLGDSKDKIISPKEGGGKELGHMPEKGADTSDAGKASCKPGTSKHGVGNVLDLQKILLQRSNNHLAGLGGSGHSSCQIDGMSPNNTYGFQNSPNNFQEAKAIQQSQYMTVITMEVQVKTRGELCPDPEHDAIQAIFYSVVEDGARQIENNENTETGIIIIESGSRKASDIIGHCHVPLKAVQVVCDELSLFKALGDLIQKWDPDIFAGYEVEMHSWGYVIERGSYLRLDVKSLLSRITSRCPSDAVAPNKPKEPLAMDSRRNQDFDDYDPIQLSGRIVLNVWRLMRSEAALMSYSFENVMYHLLHERIPRHSYKTLNDWWEHRTNLYRWMAVEYWIVRVLGVMRLLVQLDIIGRTSELARLFGIQFYEVFSRGSQFRVESMMLRLAKPLNYVCVSPSSQQRASMKAPEQLPLIMEPESRFYADPVIVLDFQSLYPSIIIGYNYCFSTCLGRVRHLGQPGPFEFGCTNLMVPPDLIAKLLDNKKTEPMGKSGNIRSMISCSPCGVAFVGKDVRHGVLPRMLSEILETRLMVKKALKENKGNRVVERVLNSRQLGLKLIANVTYGYTAANFSGRMPCIEVGDSVVSKGRETLERAIGMVHERWGSQGVRVVYGDTDSLFVLAKGFSKAEAFALGSQIAEMVTEDNPKPVKLKLEKVYQPCLLQTKKRYVGYAYETPDQDKPIFDAKGIETVRRDGCPAVAKVLEKSLRLLFDTRDVSMVKLHVQRQLGKLLSGRLSLQELTFAREYRGSAGYRPGACVPALQLARRWLSVDRRAEPRAGERVPYVIVNGPPGLPLFQLVRSPNELLTFIHQASSGTSTQCQLRVNAHYYITRVLVPPLQRCFSLIGVDVESWYADMPRKLRSIIQPTACLMGSNAEPGKASSIGSLMGSKRSTIAEYFMTSDCLSCGLQMDSKSSVGICPSCLKNPQGTVFNLARRSNSWERSYVFLKKICQSCCQRMEPIDCISLDCPVLYRMHQAIIEMEQATTLRAVLSQLAEF